ncbi:MAG: hypothetical protein NXI31_02340 [bacterium]|nr:hypothetical protein [bacterium]
MRGALLFVLVFVAACRGVAVGPTVAAEPLPEARHGHRVVALSDRLLCCGGFAPGRDRDVGRRTFELVAGAGAWRPTGDMRQSREFFGAVVIDDEAFAIGDGVERFDAATGTWNVVVPAGELPHSHFATAALGREIFVLGGYPVERSAFFVVDIDRGSVTRCVPPPGFEPGDHFHFLAAVGGELHVAGGLDAGPFEPQRQHWVREGATGAWRALPEPPPGLWAKFGGAAVAGDRWYLFGDFGGYCFRSGRGWQPATGWNGLLAMPAVVTVGEEVRAYGGLVPGGPRRPELRRYDPTTDRWQLVVR